MLGTWDASKRQLVAGTDLPRIGWVHASKPTKEEIALVRAKLEIPAGFISHSLDTEEVARIDRRGDARLIVLRVPVRLPSEVALPFEAMAVGVVLVKDLIVTISADEVDVFDALAARPGLDPSHHERFVLHLMLTVAELFLELVREIDGEIEKLEDRLQSSLRNREIYELLKYQKILVHFATALSSDRILVDRLRKQDLFAVTGEDQELLEDVEVELLQVEQMTATSGNILGEMMDAFASIISNNLNNVMRMMAALTIIVLLPSTIAAFYGMNVDLPGQHEPWIFGGLVLLSIGVALAAALIFLRKRWL